MSTSNRNSKGAQFEITGFYLKKSLKIDKDSTYEVKKLQNKFNKRKIIVFVYNLGKLMKIGVFSKFVSFNMT